MYVVETNATGLPHWLRGTVFTSDASRATVYETEAQAREALAKAAKFYPGSARRVIKAARIVARS